MRASWNWSRPKASMAPSDQRHCSRNSRVEQWSHSFTIAAQRGVALARDPVGEARDRLGPERVDRAAALAVVEREREAAPGSSAPRRDASLRPPRWTYACGLLIVKGVSRSLKRSQ